MRIDTGLLFSSLKGSNPNIIKQYCKKIILTTDDQLIEDGVQAIDDEFLEWFVKNTSCEWVLLVKEGYKKNGMVDESTSYRHKIIIPKEEPKQLNPEDFGLPQFGTKEFNNLAMEMFGGKPKQETIEEAADIERIAMDKLKNKWGHLYTFGYPQRPFPTNYENDLNNIKIGLYEGAKWQAERMYSEKDIYSLLDFIRNNAVETDEGWQINKIVYTNEELFEYFKNK
jgi:hypothetical protein